MTMQMTRLAVCATHIHAEEIMHFMRICAFCFMLGPANACLAAIRFGWQIATLTGGAPRKFLSQPCSIKDAQLRPKSRVKEVFKN